MDRRGIEGTGVINKGEGVNKESKEDSWVRFLIYSIKNLK